MLPKNFDHNLALTKAWIEKEVRRIGLSFHIDTSYADYIDEKGRTLFSHNEAREWDVSLDIACTILKQHDVDPYGIAADAMEELKTEGKQA